MNAEGKSREMNKRTSNNKDTYVHALLLLPLNYICNVMHTNLPNVHNSILFIPVLFLRLVLLVFTYSATTTSAHVNVRILTL